MKFKGLLPSRSNKTLAVYNRHVSSYIRNTPSTYDDSHTELKRWMDYCISLLPASAQVWEIGSGPGRDADYMASKGCTVLCSDGAKNFVSYLKTKGHEAIHVNILYDPVPGKRKFDMVFANSVIPHFTPRQTRRILKKVKTALRPHGIFAFNVKQGTGSEWIDEKIEKKRYVHYWSPAEIKALSIAAGYRVRSIKQNIKGDLPNHIWTQITLEKIG